MLRRFLLWLFGVQVLRLQDGDVLVLHSRHWMGHDELRNLRKTADMLRGRTGLRNLTLWTLPPGAHVALLRKPEEK